MPVEIRGYTGRTDAHAHAYHQLLVPVDGALRVTMDGLQGTTRDRVGLFIPRTCRHRYGVVDRGRFAVIDIDPLDLPERSGTTERLFDERFFTVPGALHHLAHYLAHRADGGGGRRDDPLYGLFLDALPTVAHEDGASSILSRAQAYIDANLCEPLTVEALAEALGLPRGGLVLAFRAELGQTPARYVEDKRMALALRLIDEGTVPLSEVAHRAGFSEQSALTRAVKRRFGTTPGARRRNAASRH